MKKLILILALIMPIIGFGQNVKFNAELIKKGKLYYFNESPFTGISINSWDDGGHSQVTIKNGLPNGPYQCWFSNGKLEFMGSYINGFNRDGVWKRWYENGQIRSISVYQGVNGEIETVVSNGLISIECWDKNGNKIRCE